MVWFTDNWAMCWEKEVCVRSWKIVAYMDGMGCMIMMYQYIVCSLSETTCNMSYRHVAQRFTRQNSHLEDVVVSQCQPCDGVGGCGWPIHSICSIDESTSTQPQKRCIRNSNSTWSTLSQWLGCFYFKETGYSFGGIQYMMLSWC